MNITYVTKHTCIKNLRQTAKTFDDYVIINGREWKKRERERDKKGKKIDVMFFSH